MFKPARVISCLLILLFGGCASPPRPNSARVPDWEDSTFASVVSSGPVFAAPASDVPESGNSSSGSRGNLAGSGVFPVSPCPTNGSAAVPSLPRSANSNRGWVGLQRWSRATGAVDLTRLTSGSAPSFALRSARGVFVFRTGTLIAQWDGIEVRLGFAPQLIDEQPFVHALDLAKTILPLLTGQGSSPMAGPIVLDPGHGGDDSGATSVLGMYKEKELTLDWALRLQAVLAGKGFHVVLTRSNDVNVPLPERVAAAARVRAGLFISLHFNSVAPNRAEAGLETYCLTPTGQPSSLTRGYADDPAQNFPNNVFDSQNLQLAVEVHRALLGANGNHDRGIRRARFPAVLRGQQCPAILIEGGYLSSPREVGAINDPKHRQALAEAAARGIELWANAR